MLSSFVHWNWDPVMFSIGSFAVRWYSVGFLCAFAFSYLILYHVLKREKVRSEYLDYLTVYVFLGVLLGARLGHCLFYEPDYFLTSEHFGEIVWPFRNGHFTGFTGLASHGAAIGVLTALCLYGRRYRINLWWVLDRLVIVVALGGAFVRLGNLCNSEIYGHATSLPWGFIFEREGETLPKHPTQLYEAFAYFLIFAVCLWRYLHTKGLFKSGTILGWWFVALFGVRFLIEFVKNDQVGFEAGMSLNMGQLLSLPFILGGLVIAWFGHRNRFPREPFPHGEVKTIVAKWDQKAAQEKQKKK